MRQRACSDGIMSVWASRCPPSGPMRQIWWYLLGITVLPQAERPNLWRRAAFLRGTAMMYAVLQTHHLYLAEHQFFLNRIRHVVVHHLGPFVVALACSGKQLRREQYYLTFGYILN